MQQLSLDNNTEIKGQLRPFVYLWAKLVGSSNRHERVFSPNVSGANAKFHDPLETTGGGSQEDVFDSTLPVNRSIPA